MGFFSARGGVVEKNVQFGRVVEASLAFTLGRIGGGISLAWDASPEGESVTNYNIYFGDAPGTYNGAESPIAAGNVTSYNFTLAGMGRPLYLALTAENAAGESVFSDELTAT